jgi:ABC-type glycerol-3-phosphate transport system substrate-binding protein
MQAQRLSRREFLQLSLAASGTLVAACAPPGASPTASEGGESAAPSEAPVTITMWGYETEGPEGSYQAVLKAQLDEYRGLNPNVTLDTLPSSEQQKYLVAVAGGTGPDLFQGDGFYSRELAARQAVRVLDDLLPGSSIDFGDFFDILQQRSQWKEQVIAIPRETSTFAFQWNADLVAEGGLDGETGPKTWTDMEEWAVELTKRDSSGNLEQVGLSLATGAPSGWGAWLVYLDQLGGDWLSEDESQVAFNSPEGVRALEQLVKFLDLAGGFNELQAFSTSFTPGLGQNVFMIEKIASYYHGQWMHSFYKLYAPDIVPKVRITDFPASPDDPDRKMNYAGGQAHHMGANTKEPGAAFKVLEHMLDIKNIVPWCIAYNLTPPYRTAGQSREWLDAAPYNEWYTTRHDEAEIINQVTVPGQSELDNQISIAVEAAMRHELTPQAAVEQMAEQCQAILDANADLRA